ncbi:MAG: restriction endonuclease subunit S [Taibaiella sp.]|nr:restriction endonuclease subunit S [Taibaiella sp.]
MSNWKEMRVEEIGTVISGATPNTSISEYWDGDVNWITPTDLSKLKNRQIFQSERRITNSGLKSCSANLMPANSCLVMSSRAPIGYLAIPQKEFTTNQGCKSIVLNKNQDPEYHYYNIGHNINSIKKLGEGTTFAEISKKALEKIKFNVPDYPIQKKIAKILSTIDGQIEKTEAIIAKYQAVKHGMLQDLFTRGIDVTTGELRPKYEDAPELYKDSPLGMVHKGWEVVRLDSTCAITTGSKDTQNKIDNGLYPFFVRSQTIERINSYSFDGEAILTSGDGVGVGKIYHYINGKFDFHQRVYMLYDFNNSIEPKFLYHYFKTHFLAEVDRYSAKTTVDSVRMEMIAGMLLPCPSKSEQKMAKDFIDSQELVLEREEATLEKLKLLKHGLMSDLLSGKVEVTT